MASNVRIFITLVKKIQRFKGLSKASGRGQILLSFLVRAAVIWMCPISDNQNDGLDITIYIL